jgi:hypothetical protein
MSRRLCPYSDFQMVCIADLTGADFDCDTCPEAKIKKRLKRYE